MSTFEEIKTFFSDYKFEENVLTLSNYETIDDLKTFVYTHISILNANSGKRIYLPYFDRLKRIYLIIKQNDPRKNT